jgi:hypothetical protein
LRTAPDARRFYDRPGVSLLATYRRPVPGAQVIGILPQIEFQDHF